MTEYKNVPTHESSNHLVIAETALPEGWDIAEYAGRGGRAYFAVYAQGKRMASGMTSAHSALRWARLMATSTRWSAVS